MFTGLITDVGTVVSVSLDGGDLNIGIKTKLDLSRTDIGASIACAGCCLTVVKKENDIFYVYVSAESLSKTNIGSWGIGKRVNLEKAVKAGDELGGHIVSGHVDGLAELKRDEKDGQSHHLFFSAPEELMSMIAPKGSVAIDGVSLTVNEVYDQGFGVNIIPHTWTETTLSEMNRGDTAHIEVDILARYALNILKYHQG